MNNLDGKENLLVISGGLDVISESIIGLISTLDYWITNENLDGVTVDQLFRIYSHVNSALSYSYNAMADLNTIIEGLRNNKR